MPAHQRLLLLGALLASGGAGAAGSSAPTALVVNGGRPAVKLIVDTDLGSDVSNLISVCSVNAMVDRGEAELLAVVIAIGETVI